MKRTSQSNKQAARARAQKTTKRRDWMRQTARDISRHSLRSTPAFAREALLQALRATVHRSGLLVVDTMLVLHNGAPTNPGPPARIGSPMRVGDTMLWLEVLPKPPGGLPGPHGDVPIAKESVVAVYCDGDSVHFFTWPPEDLLPESVPDAGIPHPSGDRLVPLKSIIWMLYQAYEERRLPEQDLATHRHFHERVRTAVVAELALPREKRPLIDIVFEVAGGPKLEAIQGGALSKDTLLRSLAGEAISWS